MYSSTYISPGDARIRPVVISYGSLERIRHVAGTAQSGRIVLALTAEVSLNTPGQ